MDHNFKKYFILLLFGTLFFNSVLATKIIGKVLCNGKGMPSVQISDGKNIIATDKSGKFMFEVQPVR